MNGFGEYGRPVRVFEAWKEWRELDAAARYAAIHGLQESEVDPGALTEADGRSDFPSFLYGFVRQGLWHGYQRIQPQWDRYMRVENLADFRERRLRGLNSLVGVARVGEQGDYPHLRRSERPAATLVADTYGGVYSITRHAIINDDTGTLLSRNPEDMGYAMGNFVAEAVIALIESNPTAPDGSPFYSVGRGNQINVALSEDALADAITFMEAQRDDDNFRIMVRAQALVVKTARMQMIAKRVLASQYAGTQVTVASGAGAGATVFDKGTINPLNDILPLDGVIRDAFLTDANDWYLFADPSTVPAFTIGFLNGKREPFVGLKDPGVRGAMGAADDPYSFEFDSVDFKIRHDFGVACVDPRGAFRGVAA